MILLCGIPTERPLALIADELSKRGAPFTILNQRELQRFSGNLEMREGGLGGWLEMQGRTRSLADIRGIYSRLMDDARLPEYAGLAAGAPLLLAAAARQEWLTLWWNLTPARVVNRPAATLSNCSKPWQLQIIREAGFSIPATLITSDPEAVRAFQKQHERVIYKSISSVRSIVRELSPADDARLDRIRWCPTQFQEFIPGQNVRVHVVGDRCFATAIGSEAIDYRYAASETGVPAELRPLELAPDIAAKCVALTRELRLAFSGLDLKMTPAGRVVCFEANPSPGFSYYEDHTGQPIAAAVAEYLMSA